MTTQTPNPFGEVLWPTLWGEYTFGKQTPKTIGDQYLILTDLAVARKQTLCQRDAYPDEKPQGSCNMETFSLFSEAGERPGRSH